MRAFIAALLLVCASATAVGFHNVEVGGVLPERTLPGLEGGKHPYLAKTKVTVFSFVTPANRNCQNALEHLARLEKEFADRPVAWTAIVSSTVPAEEMRAEVKRVGLTARVLKDEGDALYGELGTALTPVVGVVDEKHVLVAYLPFKKLMYEDNIRAWVRFVLGELNEEQLKVALAPPAVSDGGEDKVANRYFKLAEKQLKAGEAEKALATVKKSLEHGPDLPNANALLGAILAAQGKCAEAQAPLEKALAAQPAHALAAATRATCARDGGAVIDGGSS